jgi:hypothetical protein
MDRRKNEEGVPEILRHAYESASDVERPSDLALKRTISALRERDLLRPGDGRRRSARWTAGRVRGWIAAGLVGLAFLGGYALGRGGSPDTPARQPIPSMAGDPGRGIESVQATGTTYVLALEALANSLDRVSPAELSTARAVLRSTTTAQAESLRRLLTADGPAPSASNARNLVWF